MFDRYVGVDYSGAKTPDASLKGLRVYEAARDREATEVLPVPGSRRYWSRIDLAHWLVTRLSDNVPTIVGIDHGFSFPMRYFETHHLAPDWPSFLMDFHAHWPTDQRGVYVDFVRNGSRGNGRIRTGSARWRRLAEQRTRAKSVFHFDVPGSVAKSTHAGLPWLLYLRQQLGARTHFWPFDGWDVAAGQSVITEIYPSLWNRQYPAQGRTPDQHDAFVVASWLRQMDQQGSLARYFSPQLAPHEQGIAQIEGWILGVM
ncbi:hypothetical protein [Orrella marina]|uniref:hypothetical protein n=1 Tax=Orrella marina TaxID=2163011 RepID=UPI001D132677|nr:hypothetical protein [Orrella marina]